MESEEKIRKILELRRATHRDEDEQFIMRVEMLKAGRGSLDQAGGVALGAMDDETKELVNEVSWKLLTGTLSESMVMLLLELLEGLSSTQRRSFLGMKKGHRQPVKPRRVESAINIFIDSNLKGMSEEEAELNAYNAYFAEEQKGSGKVMPPYEADKDAPGNRHKNKAEQRMASVVRKVLIEQNLIEKPKRGRPKKQN